MWPLVALLLLYRQNWSTRWKFSSALPATVYTLHFLAPTQILRVFFLGGGGGGVVLWLEVNHLSVFLVTGSPRPRCCAASLSPRLFSPGPSSQPFALCPAPKWGCPVAQCSPFPYLLRASQTRSHSHPWLQALTKDVCIWLWPWLLSQECLMPRGKLYSSVQRCFIIKCSKWIRNWGHFLWSYLLYSPW